MSQVTFVGACGTVTGSCTLLEVGGRRVLVDCGMFQGDEAVEALNWRPFPFEARAIDGVLLTHAHLDHVGLLPKLVANGFHGPIWCTRATRPLARVVLEDAGELQEEEARFAARKGYSRHRDPKPLYDRGDAEAAIGRLEAVPFHEPAELLPGVVARFLRAGHLLGAASIEVVAKGADGRRRARRWLFSGDVGRYDAPLLVDPEAPSEAPDALLLESTYGDRRHEPTDPEEELAAAIGRAFARGGSVVVPAFALGRTQDLLFHLSRLADAGRVDPDAVFVDSPMAQRATEIYRQATPEFDEELRGLVAAGRNPLATDRFHRCRTVEDSKALNERKEPAVIVAASGMATGGRVVHHLARRLPDPRHAVLFVGYQAAGTRGRALLDGAQTISIHGRRVEVRAEIVNIHGISAHADADELVRWCRALPAVPRRVFLNHGEDAARKALASTLAELGWPRPELPLAVAVAPW